MNTEIDDSVLIFKYLEGDSKSLDILIEKYLRQIYSFVYKNVGDEAQAEDITQEVFIKVWKNINKFDQNKDFKPWIYQIAKNTSIDYLRKKKSIPFSRFENENGQNFITDTITEKPANLLENISDKKTLVTAMQGLSVKDQKIINLRHKEGFSFREIAEIFQESINTTKSRYRRTLLSMRKNIKKEPK